jgi:hypothetical protein
MVLSRLRPAGERFAELHLPGHCARAVEGDRLANERLEGGLVNFFSFVECSSAAAYVRRPLRQDGTSRVSADASPL